MKIKTSTLTGTALDWAVAKCEGAVYPPKETTWDDVKDLAVPFQMWEVTCNDKGLYWVAPITVTRCGIDERAGATAPSISATDQNGRTFRGSVGDYYLTALEAEQEARVCNYGDLRYPARYSTDWAQGGALIERECIQLSTTKGVYPGALKWLASDEQEACVELGPTPLVAGMRCYVASKMGDEIEIPNELLEN